VFDATAKEYPISLLRWSRLCKIGSVLWFSELFYPHYPQVKSGTAFAPPTHGGQPMNCLDKIDQDEVEECLDMLSKEEHFAVVRRIMPEIDTARLENYGQGLQKLGELFDEYLEDMNELDYGRRSIFENKCLRVSKNEIRKIFSDLVRKNVPDTLPAEDFLLRLDEVCEQFDINHVGRDILLANLAYGKVPIFESLYDRLKDKSGIGVHSKLIKAVSYLPRILGYEPFEIQQALRLDGHLVTTGVIDDDSDTSPTIEGYINGLSESALDSSFLSLCEQPGFPLEACNLKAHDRELLLRLLQSPQNCDILLYGEPGTGKTELTRALATALDKKLYFLDMESQNSDVRNADRNRHRFQGLFLANRRLNAAQDLLVVDEADELLNLPLFGESSGKSRLNAVLDDKCLKRIWIVNHSSRIDASTRRRFDYSIAFHDFNSTQRELIWHNLLEQKPHLKAMLPQDKITDLAENYAVNAGGIASCLRHVDGVQDPQKVQKTITSLLDAHSELMEYEYNGSSAQHGCNSRNYSLEGLNLPQNPEQILETLMRFNDYWRQHEDCPAKMEIRNMNLLAYGPPGTGKTEFARYVARKLKRKLIVESAASMLSMYVGESEKQIERSFRQAEQQNAILFIDEADSLLSDRSGAQRNWEVSQVNQLLAAMERFRGILLCATNFADNLDRASIRRFNFKLEFRPLDHHGIQSFYRKYLEDMVGWDSLNQSQKSRIVELRGLVPGDFKVVWQQHAFDSKVTAEDLVAALEQELMERGGMDKRKMGFRAS